MKSTRDQVLQTLLNHPRSTIQELAEAVGINGISIRHHISSLQAEGLVSSDEERHGVGRPRQIYYLTEQGLERFPTNYLRLTTRLLDQLKNTLPEPVVANLFAQMATDLAANYAGQVEFLNMEQRLDLVKSLLAQEGFIVEWEKQGDQYQIHEISCPYYHVGQTHPEICTVDQTLISQVLEIPVEKIQCVLRGDSHCTYLISQVNPIPEKES